MIFQPIFKSRFLLLCSLFFSLFIQAQNQPDQRKAIELKLILSQEPLAGALVINKSTRAYGISDELGLLSLEAKTGDELEIGHPNIDEFSLKITENMWSEGTYMVQLLPKVEELDEVEIQGVDANVMNGVPNAGKKPLTKAERELNEATAGRFDEDKSGLPGFAFSIDPIMNLISGKTKKAKKHLKFERREAYMDLLQASYSKYAKGVLKLDDGQTNLLFETALDFPEFIQLVDRDEVEQIHLWLTELKVYLYDTQE